VNFLDLLGNTMNNFRVDPVGAIAHQRLTAQFEQDSLEVVSGWGY
jgi:hypothetical protein